MINYTKKARLSPAIFSYLVGKERLELSRPTGQRILSPLCLPFQHLPIELEGTTREPLYL